ncbi:amidohydrolase family protein [Nisaea acidiphila]|uniref:Amidohydrolase family protein n=1 Tax=Nisaea acidiphila TaxID=1862145 RepID=A0A9J7AY83_9PROT|nr:amidohydrolase family protein [Nisaea acidiphila]UUX51228.1 amidohydrolase family protein [Nisaea acidiphila]
MSFESFLGELRADADEKARVAPPPGAVDCAVSVTSLDGEAAPAGQPEHPPHAYREVQEELGLDRLVLLPPEGGGDTDLLLKARDALAVSRGDLVEDCVRVFAGLGSGEDPARLADLAEAGIGGLKLTMLRGRETCSWDDLDRHVRRTHDLTGWNREIALDGSDLHELEQTIRGWPGETILSDCGGFRFSRSLTQPGFRALRRLIDRGRLWVKLACPYRISKTGDAGDTEVGEIARALVDWAPERMLWGSGWPNADGAPAREDEQERSGAAVLLDLLADWAPSKETRTRILLRNPEELYGFEPWPIAPEQ